MTIFNCTPLFETITLVDIYMTILKYMCICIYMKLEFTCLPGLVALCCLTYLDSTQPAELSW